ncbi:DUF397 domain-containing protein [Streptomyces maremycinicus]|nr:DUF397 domain-containing protein [Streptomyces sp. NBRC 110468]
MAEAPAPIAVRDSKTPAGPILAIEPAAFSAFLAWTGGGATGAG